MKTNSKCIGLGLVLALVACSEAKETANENESSSDGELTQDANSNGSDEEGVGGAGDTGHSSAETGGTTGESGGSSSGGGTSSGGSTMTEGTGGSPDEIPDDPGCAAARYCEDFDSYEDGTVPSAPWSLTAEGDATLVADSTRAFAGGQALHVVLNQSESGETAYIEQSNSDAVPVPGGNLFGRMMVSRTAGPTPEHHYWILDSSGGGTRLRLGGLTPGNATHIRYYLGHEPTHSAPRSGAGTLWDQESNDWFCLEWNYNTNENETAVWLNGESIPQLTQTGWNIETIDTLQLGQIMNWAPAADQEIWIDQFAIDDERIGCPVQ